VRLLKTGFRLMIFNGFLVACTLVFSYRPSTAQTSQCSLADSVNYPIDTTVFSLVQDFGVASQRHQGRYHTGEDWSIGSSSLAQPVRAAASGRVTYTAPTGWGRDGGVIIIEHTFPDGTIAYSQYGHIMQTESVVFPPRYACVQAGDIIAVIGDVRPAPHLHFEIRINQPDNPGAGYTREDPSALGFRRPAQFVANHQAWLNPAHRWHTLVDTFGPAVPPLLLEDNSMIVIDGDLLRGIGANGGVAWRVSAGGQAVNISGFQLNPYITLTDGTITRIDYTGIAQESYSLDFTPDRPPLEVDDSLVYHTSDNALVALTPDRRALLWRSEGIPPFKQAYVTPDLIALVMEDDTLRLLSTNGEQIDVADLRDGASFATAPDGRLLAYTQGGLWAIDSAGAWSEYLPDAPAGGRSSAVVSLPDGRLYLLDGQNLYAYAQNQPVWQARLPLDITGRAEMTYLNGALLIVSSGGQIVVAGENGGFCGFTRIYGDDRANLWYNVGNDGTLRVAVGNQYLGLDWARFAGSCL